MDYNDLCMGCMSKKGNNEICSQCGWVEGIQPSEQYHLPPRTILNKRYLLGRVLGDGGFGITYLAWDLKLKVKLAIKEYLPTELASRVANSTRVSVYSGEKKEQFEYGLKKFLEEATTLAKFNNHPCIVSIYDYFIENSTAYLVLAYLEGITISEFLNRKGGKIPFNSAIKIMMPVLDALREVHRFGILHRDVSPDNIFITNEKHVKLLDFGAARQAIGEKSKSLSVILKPGYAPPEQYYSKGKQGPWTDIYSSAATIYKMITGNPPDEAMERMIEDNITSPSRLNIYITKNKESVLMRALSLKSEDRYESMEEFQNEISKMGNEDLKAYVEDDFEIVKENIDININNNRFENNKEKIIIIDDDENDKQIKAMQDSIKKRITSYEKTDERRTMTDIIKLRVLSANFIVLLSYCLILILNSYNNNESLQSFVKMDNKNIYYLITILILLLFNLFMLYKKFRNKNIHYYDEYYRISAKSIIKEIINKNSFIIAIITILTIINPLFLEYMKIVKYCTYGIVIFSVLITIFKEKQDLNIS